MFGIVFLYFKKVGRKGLDVSARIIRSVSWAVYTQILKLLCLQTALSNMFDNFVT